MSLTAGAGTRCMSLLSSSSNLFRHLFLYFLVFMLYAFISFHSPLPTALPIFCYPQMFQWCLAFFFYNLCISRIFLPVWSYNLLARHYFQSLFIWFSLLSFIFLLAGALRLEIQDRNRSINKWDQIWFGRDQQWVIVCQIHRRIPQSRVAYL